MAQISPRFCLRCGAPIVQGQRFCTRCGLPMDVMQGRGDAVIPQQDSMQGPSEVQPSNQAVYHRPASSPRGFSDVPRQSGGHLGFIRGQEPGKGGMRLVILLLLLLIVLGVASYFGLALLGVGIPGSGPSGQPSITTMPINASVPYAGVMITILNAQQSRSFVDDPNTNTGGVVRLNLREQNQTGNVVSWLYSNIARLILPGKEIVSPTYVKAKVGIAPGTTQTSMVDFAVPMSMNISALALRLGASNEAQMDIPLTDHADLGKYQPFVVDVNRQMQYMGLNWTLTSVTVSLSIAGQQAPKGMRYIIVTLKVDNTLTQTAIVGSSFDYVRLEAGGTIAAPRNSTLPVSFAMGAMGKTGTVTFLFPQQSSVFTLVLLPQSQSGFEQASTDFQIA